MRKKWWMFLFIPPAIVLFTWVFGEIVMHLWNWLLPMLFGWHAVTFWQALGLLLLCRILFGGWHGAKSNGPRSGRRWPRHWERMTPQEREKFRQEWRPRCGDWGPPAGETKEPA